MKLTKETLKQFIKEAYGDFRMSSRDLDRQKEIQRKKAKRDARLAAARSVGSYERDFDTSSDKRNEGMKIEEMNCDDLKYIVGLSTKDPDYKKAMYYYQELNCAEKAMGSFSSGDHAANYYDMFESKMKLTAENIRQMIKEELSGIMSEMYDDSRFPTNAQPQHDSGEGDPQAASPDELSKHTKMKELEEMERQLMSFQGANSESPQAMMLKDAISALKLKLSLQ